MGAERETEGGGTAMTGGLRVRPNAALGFRLQSAEIVPASFNVQEHTYKEG